MAANSGAKKLTLQIPSRREDAEAGIPLQGHTPLSPNSTDYFRSIFERTDRDNDGMITPRELNAMIRMNSLTEEPIPPAVTRRILDIADADGDGKLNFQEFVKMIKNPDNNHIFGKFINKYISLIVPRSRLGAANIEVDSSNYEDSYRCWPPKVGMLIISVVELIFFVIDEVCEANSTNSASGPMAKALIYDPTRRYEAWRYVTYMFVHIGYLHLTVNVVVQLLIGLPLELVHGWRVLIIYFAGVLAGSLGTSITDPVVKLAGASGGVYSLITAHIATIIMNWSEMTYPGVQMAIFLIIIVVDVATSIWNRYYQNLEDSIGYVAHFAGALAGLLVGIVALRNLRFNFKENVLWWLAVVVYVVLMCVGILWNIIDPAHFPQQV